jgi:hypothetical protein
VSLQSQILGLDFGAGEHTVDYFEIGCTQRRDD